MQLLMSTPTEDMYLTVSELSRWSGLTEGELRGVLLPSNKRPPHDSWLRMFGITSRQSGNETAWHLKGCGNVVSYGQDDCMELLSLEPHPIFW